MRATPNLSSQGGQLIVEAVLLIVVGFGVTVAVSKYFVGQEVLKQLVSGPWQNLSGMLQNGSWGSPAATSANHPSGTDRHISIEGDKAI